MRRTIPREEREFALCTSCNLTGPEVEYRVYSTDAHGRRHPQGHQCSLCGAPMMLTSKYEACQTVQRKIRRQRVCPAS